MVKRCNNADLAENHVHPKYYLMYQLWKELTEKKRWIHISSGL